MTKRILLIALLAAAGACAQRAVPESGADPDNARTVVIPLALEPPPVYALIGYRDRLELSSQQITSLDSIATSVREENAPLLDTLEEKAVTSSRTPGLLQINPTERPLLDRIRENNRRALNQVAEVLSPEQEREVCELYEEDDRRSGRRDEDRRPSRLGRGRSPEDSAMVVRGFSVWPWCRSGAARDTAIVR